jgi:hypothetical protein
VLQQFVRLLCNSNSLTGTGLTCLSLSKHDVFAVILNLWSERQATDDEVVFSYSSYDWFILGFRFHLLRIRKTLRQDQEEDRITWTLTPHGEYTAASAYIVQFNGCVAAPDVAIIWKTWAPPSANSSLG